MKYLLCSILMMILCSQIQAQSQEFTNTLTTLVEQAKSWVATEMEAGKEHSEFNADDDRSTAIQNALHDKADNLAQKIRELTGTLNSHISTLANDGKTDILYDILDKNLNNEPYNVVCGNTNAIIETLGIALGRYAKDEKAAGNLLKILEKADTFLATYEGELAKLATKLDGSNAKPAMRDAAQRLIINAKVTAYERLISESLASAGANGQTEVSDFLQKKGLKHKSWQVRLGVLKALSKNANFKDVSGLLEVAKSDKDARVAAMAIQAIAYKGNISAEVKEALKKALGNKTDVVVSAAANTIAILKIHSLIPDIIAALAKSTGKLSEDLERALKMMTGESHEENAKVWEIRWKTVLAEKLVDGQPSPLLASNQGNETKEEKKAGFSYYGITTASKKIVFIFDISGSMRKPAAEDEKIVSGESRVVDKEEKIEGTTKIDVAKKQLIKAIEKLDPKTSFNVIVFSNTFHRWSKEMQLATPANKKDVTDFINKQPAKGATNIFDPIEAAIQAAGRGAFDKHYEVACDTIFLVTDGSPNRGRVSNADDIIKEVAKMNELGRITIHAIGIGPEQNSKFMRELTEKNGGTYESRGTKTPPTPK